MTLEPGARLGPYDIRAAIGAGGMGEVYLAHDPRLGRDVAIKVLPAGVAGDPERRARFEREAKAVAALNHPNIVTIFAVEEAAGVPFFSMEYVEGRTLAEVIPPRGLPTRELLRIAIPLTDAVGAAHQRGILHRDLKPANVMMTADGRVKVLDFGLAKLWEALTQPDATGPPTAVPTHEPTGEGRILGTVAYMSPEQAEGKALDQRSDVFSLGIMLYEMATGQRPFKGDTSMSVISAILKDTPASVTDVRPELPRDLGRIVKHALSKDPEHRYQTAKDLRNDLETLKEDLDSGEARPASETAAAAVKARGRWWIWVAAVIAAGGLIAAGAYVSWPAKAPEAQPAARPFDEITIGALTSDGRTGSGVAISPDGRYVAHVVAEQGREGVRVRQVDTTAFVQAVAPADVQILGVTFTPDGSRLTYVAYPRGSGTASLYEVPVLGGAPRRLIDDVDREVSFSPDGARFAFVRGVPKLASAIMLANADGTGERTLAERRSPSEFVLANPAWSPDGSVIAAAAYDNGIANVGLVEVDAGTGEVRPVGTARWNSVSAIRWLPAGGALLVCASSSPIGDQNQIWLVPYPAGAPHRITNDLAGYARISLTADGRTLVATRIDARGSLWAGPASRPGETVEVAGVPTSLPSIPIAWTADGRILFTANVGGNIDVWSTRPDGTDMRQLTTSPGADGFPAAARDNRQVVFVSNRDGGVRVWRMDPDGSRQTPLTPGPNDMFPLVSGDSTTVYFTLAGQPDTPLYQIPIGGGTPAPAFASPAGGREAVMPKSFVARGLTPDGSSLFGNYWDDKAGRTRLAVVDATGRLAARPLDLPVALGLVYSFAWAPDGRAITFARTTGGSANIWRQPLDGGAQARVTNFTGGDAIAVHAWSPDGGMLAMVRVATTRDVVVIRDVRR